MLTENGLHVVAENLAFPEGPVVLSDGSLLVVEIRGGTLLKILPSGNKVIVAELGGGPNGAAIGPDGKCYVCNNGGFRWVQGPQGWRPAGPSADYKGGLIQVVDLQSGHFDALYTHVDGRPLRGPNDIVFDATGGFWFTDFGKARERDVDRGGVYYASCDGRSVKEVIFPMWGPNGIALSPDERALYVTETETGRVWTFELAGPGQVRLRSAPTPHGGRLVIGLPGYQRLDSMAIQANGHLVLATLSEEPGITVVSPDGEVVRRVPLPDPLTTNICFGGLNLKTAFVTLSGRGELVSMDWPSPGLRLNYA